MPESGIITGEALNILAASGMVKTIDNLVNSFGTAIVGSAYGEDAGNLAGEAFSSAAAGALAGAALIPIPIWGPVIGGIAGGLIGAMNGLVKNYQKDDDSYKEWYNGLYEQSRVDSAQSLLSGSALAGAAEQERLLALGKSLEGSYLSILSEVESRRSQYEENRGEGFNEVRKEGLIQEQAAYDGPLGTALAEANRAIGGSQAHMENLSADYRQEALSAVLTGAETKLDWDEKVKGELAELAVKYQEAMTAYEAGDESAGLRVDAYLRETEILAQAQYDSSEAVLALGATEVELVEAVRENTKELGGWKPTAELNNALSKGKGDEFSLAEQKGKIPSQGEWYSYDLQDTTEVELVKTIGNNGGGESAAARKNEGNKGNGDEFTLTEQTGKIPSQGTLYSFNLQGAIPDEEGVQTAGGVDFSESFYLPEMEFPWVEPTGKTIAPGMMYSNSLHGAMSYGAYVPHNNYAALLHQGERVLTAQEARRADAGGGGSVQVSVTGNEFTVRNENDLDAIGQAIASAMERKLYAGVVS